MTCRKGQRCQQCDPVSDLAFTKQGNRRKRIGKARAAEIERLAWTHTEPTYRGEGMLAYEMSHPGKQSHRPTVELCSGCLARVMAL
jgi:hypothetical protein